MFVPFLGTNKRVFSLAAATVVVASSLGDLSGRAALGLTEGGGRGGMPFDRL